MEDLSSYSQEHLSDVCRLLLADPNYSPENYVGFSDDDDDPLGRTENTVKINDDWTVSSEEKLPAVQDDDDDDDDYEDGEEDENELESNDDDVVEYFLNDLVSPSEKESSLSDEEEQIVPTNPNEVCKLKVGEELTLTLKEVVDEEKKEEEEEGEKNDVSDEEIVSRSDVEKETGNRSNPQPP